MEASWSQAVISAWLPAHICHDKVTGVWLAAAAGAAAGTRLTPPVMLTARATAPTRALSPRPAIVSDILLGFKATPPCNCHHRTTARNQCVYCLVFQLVAQEQLRSEEH